MRKSGETGLRSNAPLFRSIFDNAQIGTSFFSVEGREAFTNRAFQQRLGYSEEELSHLENWDKIVHPDDRASSAKRYAELQQGSVTSQNAKKWRRNETASPQIRRLHLSSGAMPIYRVFKMSESCRVDDEVIWRRDGTPIAVEYSSCRTGKYPCGHL